MEIRKNMAEFIRMYKVLSEKTMTELAEELEILRSALQQYMAAEGNPNAATIDHLATKLNVDPALMISGAFSSDQVSTLMKMLDLIKSLARLPSDKRKEFTESILRCILLLDGCDESG